MNTESIYSQSDREQDRVLLQLEHPDWTDVQLDEELEKRRLKTTCGVGIDPDSLPAEDHELIEQPLQGREEILAAAEKLDPSIYAHLIGERTVRQVARDLGVSVATAHSRIQKAKRCLRSILP